MGVSAELQEAAIRAGARAYVVACHHHLDGLGPEQELMALRIAEHQPGGSNGVRAACIAVLEYMDLRDPQACPQCSFFHYCDSCGSDFTHHEAQFRSECAKCWALKELERSAARS